MNDDFINKLTRLIEANLSNEQFGVSELAGEIGMSRSNLLRKVRKLTKLSVSQFIRKLRLENAMLLLREKNYTVSEVSYSVGFNSTSYFVKCFHEHYGFPPGEVIKGLNQDNVTEDKIANRKRIPGLFISLAILVLAAALIIIIFKPFSKEESYIDNSIAVLPFKNDSNDSTNLYIINGLMESILNKLQKIDDLRVISRTSVEKYRYTPVIIPEMAKELNVRYFVEGSGQKIGDEIFLSVQLIEARTDKHIWSEQYIRKAEDIFKLQMEVAKNIADKIQVIITPEEERRIEKVPTQNLVAYDYFLRGLELLNDPVKQSPEAAIHWFSRAIDEDSEFARAYAAMAISYYLMDKNMATKNYTDQVNSYADKALLYDDQLAQSLIAKALYYMSTNEFQFAVSYFEKALEYNPNHDLVYAFLVDLYANHLPDTEKYLEYALKGISIDIGAYDSTTVSFSYLHISNAFIQSGFIDEAELYINMSLDYSPENIYSLYVKPYIVYARNRDLQETCNMLLGVLEKDTTRLDVIQEIAKIYYYMRDYQSAYNYYKIFIDGRNTYKLDIYPGEDAKIGVVFSELGYKDEADKIFADYLAYAENDKSIYKNLSLAVYYSYMGDIEKSLDHLQEFSKQDIYNYWTILFLSNDPLIDNIREQPECKVILDEIESAFWKYHKRIRASLEVENLI